MGQTAILARPLNAVAPLSIDFQPFQIAISKPGVLERIMHKLKYLLTGQ